jgi:alpha-N-arabinofuranosidase
MLARREFLRNTAALAAAQSAAAADANAVVIDPAPLFEISPWLYMQFMEPLGTTDSSVEAAWNYDKDDWRQDFVDVVADLAPGAMRFGGLYSRYYHWREGVGPAASRPWHRNYVWGGKETNRVGTHEFVDFCRRVKSEPFYCVNFLSDGEQRYRTMAEGNRTGDALEAADWVSYANDPDHAERRRHGSPQPYNIKLWQLGNETSYGDVTFGKDASIAHTIEFARAMRARDNSIRLIGWGDKGHGEGLWAKDLIERAGEHLDFVAIHMMGQSPKRPDSALRGLLYQQEPARAWEELLELSNAVETRVAELESVIAGKTGRSGRMGIAITEGHLSLGPRNMHPILFEWLSSVYHARSLNIYQRHGAQVRIATAADFQGTRWTNNAVMVGVPAGRSYLMPVASIARLFRRYNGTHGVAVRATPAGLDIAASRSGNSIYLHVANLQFTGSVEAAFVVEGMKVASGQTWAIAPDHLRQFVSLDQPNVFAPRESPIPQGDVLKWRFPAGSVTAVELRCV